MAKWMLGLMGWVVACSVQAGILYQWEATCIERYHLSDDYEGGRLELGCEQPIRGTILMPDSYIPGTKYVSTSTSENWLPAPDLTINDPHFGSITLGEELDPSGVYVQLPVQSGPGFVGSLWPSGHYAFPGQTAFELFANSSFVIVSEDAIFTRVPEPGTLSLAALALGIAATRVRRSPRRRCLQSVH